MKTTMVAGEGVWSPGKGGLRSPPRMLSLLCRRCSHPAGTGGADAGGPRLPPSVLIRTGGRMLGQAKTLRRSCSRAGSSLSRGRLRGGRRGQSPAGGDSPSCAHRAPRPREKGRGGPSSGPRPSRLLPRTARTTAICSSRLGASVSPTPPSWTPGTPQTLLGTANQSLPSTTVRPTGRNWEELGGFCTLAMTQHRQQGDIPHARLSPVSPQDPARRAPFRAGSTGQGQGCLSLGTGPRHGHKGWQHRGKTSSGTSLTSSSSCCCGGR